MRVDATVRARDPSAMSWPTSSYDDTLTVVRPCTYAPVAGECRTLRPSVDPLRRAARCGPAGLRRLRRLAASNRSRTFSL